MSDKEKEFRESPAVSEVEIKKPPKYVALLYSTFNFDVLF